MHALAYLQKRGHLSAVALGRKMFDRVPDMTPARFDVLHILFDNVRLRGLPVAETRVYLATIRQLLGLARQTVWKMVKRLVELGLLERHVCPFDRRQILVNLTDTGLARIKQAYTAAFSERYRVPPQPDGSPPSRKAYRAVHKEAKTSDYVARLYAEALNPKFFPPHVVKDATTSRAPPRFGREVTKVFKSIAKKRGRRRPPKRRLGTIGMLTAMTRDARALAQALGDTSSPIYPHIDFEALIERTIKRKVRRAQLVVDPWTGALVRRPRRRRPRSERRPHASIEGPAAPRPAIEGPSFGHDRDELDGPHVR